MRSTLFKKYRKIVTGIQAAAEVLVTQENIHEVKVALTGKFITVDNKSVRWSYSAF